MRNIKQKALIRIAGFIAVFAVIGLLIPGCGEPSNEDKGKELTGTVSIEGTAEVGQTLTAVTSALGGSGTITYQWKRGTANVGTNSHAYEVHADDIGSAITVTVTRAGYTGSKTSEPTGLVPVAVITVPGVDLAAKLQWLKTSSASNRQYIIEVNKDETIAPYDMSYEGKTEIEITIIGIGQEREISLTQNGTLFTVGQGVTLILENMITLSGKETNTGILVNVIKDGKLIMKDGSKITKNRNRGVQVADHTGSPSFEMDGGEISENVISNSSGGGGVLVGSGGSFIMHDGLITKNKVIFSTSYGGGVNLMSDATFIMNGGEISENISNGGTSVGGGVAVSFDSVFTMNDGVIKNNKTIDGEWRSGEGGGVNVVGIFTMNGGEITGNDALDGGGVFVRRTFNMNNGVIAKNTARDGGGIYVYNPTKITKSNTGGIIYGSDGGDNANTATRNGAAMYTSLWATGTSYNNTIGENEGLNLEPQ